MTQIIFIFSGDGHGSVDKFSVVSENQVLIFWVLIYLRVWLPWWKAVLFCLCCPKDGSALSTGWIFPFAQVHFACVYLQSHLQPLDDWKEQYDFCITALATCYFFYISSSKSGNHSCFRSMSGSHFNPRYLLQSFPGPPNLAGSGPGAAHQLGQGCHQGCGPSNTAQGVLQPFRLCSLRAWRFCIPARLADWHQENQVCMASEAVGISSHGLPFTWQNHWSVFLSYQNPVRGVAAGMK